MRLTPSGSSPDNRPSLDGSGPYVVTTKRPNCSQGARCTHATVARRAVATLEEAKTTILDMPGCRWLDAVALINESGGTVGPLPDGTVIQVEAIGQHGMRHALRCWASGLDTRDALDDTISGAWVDAFNARENPSVSGLADSTEPRSPKGS